MADEATKQPSSFPSLPQQSHPGPPLGGEAQSAESLPPPPQQLPGAPPRQAQTSIMQDLTAAASSPSTSKQPPIPSLREPAQPLTTSDPRFASMDTTTTNSNQPLQSQTQDITMDGAAEQQPQQHNLSHSIPTGSGTGTGTSPTPKVRAGGAPARIFLNENIVPYLLEGMKTVTRDQPQNPLRALGEYLIQKSNEVEGGATAGGGGGVNIKTESK